jgi:hypothetical protein
VKLIELLSRSPVSTLSSVLLFTVCTAVFSSFSRLFYRGSTTLESPGLQVVWVSSWHSDTPQSVGLLWTSDLPAVAHRSYVTTHNTQQDRHPWPRRNSYVPIAASGRPKPHAQDRAAGRWMQHRYVTHNKILPCSHTVCVYIGNGVTISKFCSGRN